MRSHLTRRVFRRLIANEPLFPCRHVHTGLAARPRGRPRPGVAPGPVQQRRTFLNIFNNKQKDLREPTLDPGMEKMLELDKRIHLIARLPPAQDLVEAFNAFIDHRAKRERPIEDFHAVRLLQTLETLEKPLQGRQAISDASLSSAELLKALNVLAKHPKALTRTHNTLARAIFTAIETRHKKIEDLNDNRDLAAALSNLLVILTQTRDSQDALDMFLRYKSIFNKHVRLWRQILAGFVKEDNEKMIFRTLDLMKEGSPTLPPSIQITVALYYAKKNNVQATKEWFQEYLEGQGNSKESARGTYKALLEFCIRNNELKWGQSLLQRFSAGSSEEMTWDAIFRAAAATGKSVDDIDRMMSLMSKESGQSVSADTINGLIEFSMSRNDAYAAERYFSLMERWDIQPNVQSYILQTEYRLAAGDVTGALRSYDKLRHESINNDEDWLVMNKLLLAVLAQPGYTNETVVGLVEDISDRRRVFPADTVIALCGYHLKRDEFLELVDLLQTYAYQYSIAERMRMRDYLVQFTLDPKTDTGRAWDTYMIFHQIFDLETHREIRNDVVTSFFDRGRPDLATHVFSRMSRHVRADTRPNEETYVRMFEGVAKTADSEALEIVHNLLKLDTETDPTTRVLNGLMMAYTACDAPRRALEFWEQVSTSDEGPSYNSLHIAFRACEKAPWGYKTAKTIWDKLLQSDIVIEKDLFASYVGMLSGQSLFDEMTGMVDKMQEVVGEGLDVFTLGTIHNAAVGINWQERIEEWAKEEYPAVWEELNAQGHIENEMGIKLIKGIDRSIRA